MEYKTLAAAPGMLPGDAAAEEADKGRMQEWRKSLQKRKDRGRGGKKAGEESRKKTEREKRRLPDV